ncbi:Non-specific serine/threonine protein kinase [Sulfidibacter corallicola]|uniref:Protein kinase n=1 Tax=Sulfidibacter corallicola TaxID=2818388 RepID=A0A8A4TJY2_SULCO|nr:serine/threonine-protein kinase [Sulfidibacter corallicola]QTD49893.1 protein kinase [Sulfidibacter corallicola]
MSDTEKLKRIDRLLERVVETPPDERDIYLDKICDDEDLKQEVRELLTAYGKEAEERQAAFGNPGDRLGPYRLENVIGQGGMGTVYLAEQVEGVSRKVAVKLVRWSLHEKTRSRFDLERQLLAKLNHRYIASLIEVGETPDGLPYLVMEHVEGRPIHEFAEAEHLSFEERIRLFSRVCEAVAYAHARGIIHRDIKPSNILVTKEGGAPVPKLIDFGIARTLEHGETISREIQGTLEYMSPEQTGLSPSAQETSTHSDVYALGALLYRLILGRPPLVWDKRTPLSHALRDIVEKDPPRPRSLFGQLETAAKNGLRNNRVSTDFDAIVMKALAKSPRDRYQTAQTLKEDLHRLIQALPVSARPQTPGYLASRYLRRHFWPALTAFMVILLILALPISIAVTQSREQKRTAMERDRAEEVIALFTEILASGDPALGGDPNLEVRQILDRTRSELPYRLRNRPEIHARLEGVLGEAYLALGLYSESDFLLENARESLIEHQGAGSPKLVQPTAALFELRMTQDDFDRAEPFLAELEHIAEQHEDQPLLLAEALFSRGRLLAKTSKHTEAVTQYREALRIFERRLGKDALQTLRCMKLLGQSTEYAEGLAEAVTLYQTALDMARKGSVMEGDLSLSLAVALSADRRFPEAEPNYRRALELFDRHYGDKSLKSAVVRIRYAYRLIYHKNDLDRAEPMLQIAENTIREKLGERSTHLADVFHNRGMASWNRRNYEDAACFFREAVNVERAANPGPSVQVTNALRRQAFALLRSGRPEEALAVALESNTMAHVVFADNLRFRTTNDFEFAQIAMENGFYAGLRPTWEAIFEFYVQQPERVNIWCHVLAAIAYGEARSGHCADAWELMDHAYETVERAGDQTVVPLRVIQRYREKLQQVCPPAR